MKRIYFIIILLLPIRAALAQNMQPSNLVKTPLFNYPNEDVAVLRNPIMYGEGNGYDGGQQVQGAIQLVTPLKNFMFDVEGTIMRFGPGWQEKIRFHLNAYGWGHTPINYTANPIKAYWDKQLADLQDLPVTLGNLLVNGVPTTTITIGNGNTNWGSYMVIVIDKVYLTNKSAGNYLFDENSWQLSKVAQINTTENVSTVFGPAPLPKAMINESIDGQNLTNTSIVPSGQFKVMNGSNVIGAPSANYWNILSLRHNNPANDYRMEIAGAFHDVNDLKFRNTNNNPSQGWNTFFHSGNTAYARTSLGLPASGGFDLQSITSRGNQTSNTTFITGNNRLLGNPSSEALLLELRDDGAGGKVGLVGAYDYVNMHYIDLSLTSNPNVGNVGIGTTVPQYKLDVTNNVRIGAQGGNDYTLLSGGSGFGSRLKMYHSDGTENIRLAGDNDSWMNANYGNVGIGTTTPQEKLSVNGKIKAKEVKVQPTGWSDYVFEDNYQLLSLSEISSFIKKNKHLPDVPSAKEVAQNGIELGEMNKTLLKKIEELTLLLIEQHKLREMDAKRITELEKKI